MPNEASRDFRNVYANGISFVLGDNDFRLTFGLSEVGDPTKIIEHTAVYLTHKMLKVLARSTTELVAHYEKMSGETIPFDEEREVRFKSSLDEAAEAIASATSLPQPS